MEITAELLNQAFAPQKEGDLAEFGFVDGLERFTGHVISHRFSGMSVPDRQNYVWDVLRARFGEDASQVSLVLTFSPEEWEEVGTEAA